MLSNALKASNFGVTKCLCKSTPDEDINKRKNRESLDTNNTPNNDGQTNVLDSSRVSSNVEKILAPRRALKEINSDINGGGKRFGCLENLDQNKATVIHEMLLIEKHHVEEIIRDSSGRVRDVVWCPSYVRPALEEPRGGDEISHHRCKSCQKISFHLLHDGQKYRPCLKCADWSENDIPSWYYHNGCDHCKLK